MKKLMQLLSLSLFVLMLVASCTGTTRLGVDGDADSEGEKKEEVIQTTDTEINEKAPVIQSADILIKADIEKVWKVMININEWSSWNKNIKNSRIIGEGELAVGSVFKWKNNGSNITSTIHTLKKDAKSAVMGWTGKNFAAKAIHNWYLEETEEGTLVRTEESMSGVLMKMLKKKMKTVLGDDMTGWLQALKDECEKKEE